MGKFKLGVVLVTWPDGEPDGRTTDWYHDYFCNPAREGIARYWYQQSQGKLVFEGDVLDWVPLKATLKDLQKKDKDGKPTENRIDRTTLVNWAIFDAHHGRGFDENKYDGLVVVAKMTLPPGWLNDGGSGSYVQGGKIIPFSMIPAGTGFDFTAHEIGHQLDLDHSYGFDCYKNRDDTFWGEYGHFYCIMSASAYGGVSLTGEPTFDLPGYPNSYTEFDSAGPSLNGGSRLARGWVRGFDFKLEPGANTTQILHSLGSTWEGNPLKVIHLIKSPEDSYTVEYRSKLDHYDRGLPESMVVINALRGSTADRDHPNTNSATYLGEIREVGESFTSEAQFRVELLGISPNGQTAEVRVSETAKPWRRWFQIHQETVFNQKTQVTALARTNDHMDLFKVGFDGAVWSSWWRDDDQGWQDWFQIHPETVFSQETAVTALARHSKHVDLFVAGFDGRIWSSWWGDDDKGWQKWFKVRPEKHFQKTTAVTAVSRNSDHIDLFVIEAGEVWSSWWHDDDQGWRAWFKIRPEKGFSSAKQVTAVSRNSTHVDLFVLDEKGIVWSSWWQNDGQGWRPWFPVNPGTNFPNYAQLTAVSRNSDHVDLFVTDNNGVVWSCWWHDDEKGWRNWFQINPKKKLAKVAKVTAFSRAANHVDLFATDAEGRVWSCWWHQNGKGWRDWFAIHPEIKFAGEAGVTAVSRGDAQVDLFVVGFDRVVWSSNWPLEVSQPSPHTTASPIYAIQQSGTLRQYKHVGDKFGTPAWCKNKNIGNSWHNFKRVFSGGSGIIYAITKGGDLLWYRHTGRFDAAFSWDGPFNVRHKSHEGWHNYKQIFSDGGAIYAIQPGGSLLRFEHLGRHDGSNSWAKLEGIGTGWHNFKYVFAGGPGIIYGIKPDGRLLWYRVSRKDKGAFFWIGPNEVHNGWQNFKQVFTDGRGLIYAILNDGSLYWYRHLGFQDGSKRWKGPKLIGSGWGGFREVFI